MKKILVFITISIIAIITIYCLIKATPQFELKKPENTNVAEETQDSATQIIKTKKDDMFSIVLSSNPSTGFEWKLEFDSEYIQFVEEKSIPSLPAGIPASKSAGLDGRGSKSTFNFFALKSGETKITFSDLRPMKKFFKVIIE